MTTLGASADQASRLRSLVRALRSDQAPEPTAEPEQTTPAAPCREAVPAARPRATVVAVASGKGGVGKTVVAVNLAVALGKCLSVALIDADLGAANADIMLGERPTRRLDASLNAGVPLSRLVTEAAGGIRLIAGAVGTRRMIQPPSTLYGRLAEIDGLADLIVIDLPAGLDPMVIDTCARADQTLIVTTHEPTAIADAYATIKAVTAWRTERACTPVQRLEVVVNQSPGDAVGQLAHQRLATVAQRFLARRVRLAGVLPADGLVARSIAARTPAMLARPDSPFCEQVRALAEGVMERRGASDAPVSGI